MPRVRAPLRSCTGAGLSRGTARQAPYMAVASDSGIRAGAATAKIGGGTGAPVQPNIRRRMAHIIISYRRADSDAIAGRIRDKLATHFGEDSVFMDIDSIPFGIDFREH